MPTRISVDLDLTLIDEEERLLPGVTNALAKLKSCGCKLTLWSATGAERAKSLAHEKGIHQFFDSFEAKPDVIVDDDPESVRPHLQFQFDRQRGWAATAEVIVNQLLALSGQPGDRNELVALVGEHLEEFSAYANSHDYGTLFPKHLPLNPLPFFGNPLQAEVLTFALNPARTEFSPDRNWLGGMQPTDLVLRLLSYFRSGSPKFHPFFRDIEKALLFLECSYERNAAHLDLFPHPTWFPRELQDEQKCKLASLILANEEKFRRLLQFCRLVKLVIVIDLTMCWTTEQGGDQQLGVSQTLQRWLPNLSTGMPSVIYVHQRRELMDYLFTNRHELRRHIRTADCLRFE
jgi:hypothetical protein